MNIKIVACTKLDINEIISFLKAMDKEFPTPLSERVDLDKYTVKFCGKGSVICALYQNKIVGLLGGYCNNHETKKGYISVLIIDRAFRGNKISKHLLEDFIQKCKASGMKQIEVHTYKTNIEAIGLYEKFGFEKRKVSDEGYIYYIKTVR